MKKRDIENPLIATIMFTFISGITLGVLDKNDLGGILIFLGFAILMIGSLSWLVKRIDD